MLGGPRKQFPHVLPRHFHSSPRPPSSMRVHSHGWLKDVSRIQAMSEIERGQEHEQEELVKLMTYRVQIRDSVSVNLL